MTKVNFVFALILTAIFLLWYFNALNKAVNKYQHDKNNIKALHSNLVCVRNTGYLDTGSYRPVLLDSYR